MWGALDISPTKNVKKPNLKRASNPFWRPSTFNLQPSVFNFYSRRQSDSAHWNCYYISSSTATGHLLSHCLLQKSINNMSDKIRDRPSTAHDKRYSTTSLYKLNESASSSAKSLTTDGLRRPKSHHDIAKTSLHHLRTNTSTISSAHTRPSTLLSSRKPSTINTTVIVQTSEVKSVSSSPIQEFAPLLYRTGSRVWEDIQESKGQSWLGTRQSSTNLYSFNRDTAVESDDEDEDEYSRTRNLQFTYRSSSRLQSSAGADAGDAPSGTVLQSTEEYNPISYVAHKPEVNKVLQFELGKPRFMAGGSDDENDDEDDEDGSDIENDPLSPSHALHESVVSPLQELDTSTIEPSNNKIIAAIDWLLGVGYDSHDASTGSLFHGIYSSQPVPMTRTEKVKRRDGEQGLNIDVALLLGTISCAI